MYLFLVFGDFIRGSTIDDKTQTVNVEIGRSKTIVCPKHSYAYPAKYFWATKKRTRPVRIQQDRRVFLLDGGKTLFFSYVTKEDVEKYNKEGGVVCVLTIGTVFKYSHRIKFFIDGHGKIEVLIAINEDLKVKNLS